MSISDSKLIRNDHICSEITVNAASVSAFNVGGTTKKKDVKTAKRTHFPSFLSQK